MTIDTTTIIRARRGKRLAKMIRADGTIDDYDSAFVFDLISHPVADLDALHQLLRQLLFRPDCAVVRGVPIDRARCTEVRRLAYRDNDTGDEPTLRAAPHRWLALDLDGVERPESVSAADIAGCAAEAIQRLPVAFHGVRCIAHASGSHGIKPGVRLRLWHWLDRPTTGDELTRWLRGTPADPSVFRTVQPIYTAAPVFAPGVHDHLPQRIVELPGRPEVPVPSPGALAAPSPRPPAPIPNPTDAGAGRYAFAALINAAVRVRQAGEGQRHDTLLREARALARFVAAGLLTEGDLSGVLRGAGVDAGKPEDEIDKIVSWAMDHPSPTALLEGMSS